MIQKKTLYSQGILSSNNVTGTWMYPGKAVDELERFSEIEKKILRPKHVIPISVLTNPLYNSSNFTLSPERERGRERERERERERDGERDKAYPSLFS
jgi:hypothetical protein